MPPFPPIPRSISDSSLALTSTSLSHIVSSQHDTRKRSEGRGRARKRNTRSSDLTAESLEKFNGANQGKGMVCSPYYNGFPEPNLYVARRKLPAPTSPGSESHSTTSSSISTVFVRIQEWSTSCFKGKDDPKSPVNCTVPKAKIESFSSVNTIVIREAVELRKKELVSAKIAAGSASYEEKPLRERVSTPAVAVEAAEDAVVVEKQPVLVENKLITMKGKAKENIMTEEKFVWANQYRPKALEDFICNKDTAKDLKSMVETGQCSHYIFEGPNGVGKRTMVRALLREAFGPENLTTTKEIKEFTLKGEPLPSIKVNVRVSLKHVEINVTELGGYEKHVIVDLIKENHKTLDKAMQCDHTNCHAIILHEADKLSTDAQLYIRWIMERNKGCNKIFFCCHDASKLQTVKSLCKVVQLLPPSNKEIVQVLEFIAEQRGIELPRHLAERITEKSQQNLRQAIRSFEASWQLNSPLTEDQVILTGWEEDIANIAQNIVDEQSPKQLYIIRGKLQCLIDHNVSPEFIFPTLVDELKKILPQKYHSRVDALYQEYNKDGGRTPSLGPVQSDGKRKSVHQFLKIEEFTAKFMSCYRSSLLDDMNESDKDVR